MKAEIITISSHLLRGQPLNLGVDFLTRELIALGIPVRQSVLLRDNSEDLKQALKTAEERSDLIIITGGLGPDEDDITKTTIAEYLDNEINIATGLLYKKEGKTYILLPASFDEVKPMFLEKTRPLIIKKLLNNAVIETQLYSLYGLTLAQVNEQLSDLITYDGNPFVGIYYEEDEIEIQITAQADSKKEAKVMIDEVAKQVSDRVGEYIYGENEERLAHVVKKLLKEQGKKITAAESLTGGSFLNVISGEGGASDIFDGGIVTYSNHVKNNVLGVTQETIDQYGVVSPQCAIEMAEKSMEMFEADMSVSLTGVAGPSSLEGEIPGAVWIGLAQEGKEPFAKKFHFGYTRERNRRNSVFAALNLARLALLNKPIENQVFL